LNSLFDIEMKVYYVTEVFKQGINFKTTFPNYTFKLEIALMASLFIVMQI